MKIGLLGWDYSGIDPDGGNLVDFGRERGHTMSFFTLEEIACRPGGPDGLGLTLRGEPAGSFDAVISRAKLHGEDFQGRIERLSMLGGVPGLRLFDPAEAWLAAESKFRTTQVLAAHGLPVAPTCSVTTLGELEAACAVWGTVILKPSFGFAGQGVERLTGFSAGKATAEKLLARYSTLLCQPYYPTEGGEYRITVAGEATPINVLKLPAPGSWRCKTLDGASFERFDAPAELIDISLRATRALGLTLAGLDILPTADGYVILEVNPVPGFLGIFGAAQHRQVLAGVFDWVESACERPLTGKDTV